MTRRRSALGRRSDIGRLHHATLFRSRRPLMEVADELDWTPAKVERVVAASHGRFRFVKGGNTRTIANYGTEQGRLGSVAVYNAVLLQLRSTWARSIAKSSLAFDTSRGVNGGGALQRPDAVMLAYPKRGHTKANRPQLHVFEIEAYGRFSIHSLYQAHSHGRFADQSWVVFVRDTRANEEVPILVERNEQQALAEWEHMEWVARQLGVGVISCSNPAVSSTWVVHHPAARSTSSAPDRVASLLPGDLPATWSMTYAEFRGRRAVLENEHRARIGGGRPDG